MRAVIQRVLEAHVSVEGRTVGKIGRGLLVFLGVHRNDSERQAEKLSDKIVRLRVFNDIEGRMNLDLLATHGELLIVSQFTLYGQTAKGNRPSYSDAAPPAKALELYEFFIKCCRDRCTKVQTGQFQAHMKVHLINDGPVTLLCDAES
jgi:D-tyrosyl-tRNA(Tyr) deacylase